FQVSRNTVIEDIKSLKGEVGESDIQLVSSQSGYRIHGDEMAIRDSIVHYLMDVTPQETWISFLKHMSHEPVGDRPQPYAILSLDGVNHVKRYVEAYEKTMKLEITDDVRDDVIIWFYFFVKRMKHGY